MKTSAPTPQGINKLLKLETRDISWIQIHGEMSHIGQLWVNTNTAFMIQKLTTELQSTITKPYQHGLIALIFYS